MSKFVTSFLKDESGASAAEYVLILAIVGAAVAVGAGIFGGKIQSALSDIGDSLDTYAGKF